MVLRELGNNLILGGELGDWLGSNSAEKNPRGRIGSKKSKGQIGSRA